MHRYGRLVLRDAPAPVPLDEAAARLLAAGAASSGAGRLNWTAAQRQIRERVAFLRAAEGEEWPDLSDAALSS